MLTDAATCNNISISGHSQRQHNGHIHGIIGAMGAHDVLSGLVVVIIITALHTFYIGNILRHWDICRRIQTLRTQDMTTRADEKCR